MKDQRKQPDPEMQAIINRLWANYNRGSPKSVRKKRKRQPKKTCPATPDFDLVKSIRAGNIVVTQVLGKDVVWVRDKIDCVKLRHEHPELEIRVLGEPVVVVDNTKPPRRPRPRLPK